MYDVLGYPRTLKIDQNTDCAYLNVLPFHTGPIGLLPGTEVHVSLTEGPNGCEILVRPYQSNADNLMQLDCTMHDGPGVLARLVAAVSDFDINIVNKVSAATDLNHYHRTCMLLDWTTSKYKQKIPSTLAQQRYYRQYHSVFPVTIRRCLELFESIVERCGDVIVSHTINGLDLPMLSMREMSVAPQVLADDIVTVKPYHEKYQVKIDLPKALLAMLRYNLQVSPSHPLVYIPLAEPDTKTLRAFFPRPTEVAQIIHIAFFHLDMPHAYETILHCLRDAGFNILTSLIRGHKEGENVVEAVLQASGDPPVAAMSRDGASTRKLCAWIAGLVAASLTQKEADLLELCNLRIGMPLHPRPENLETVRLSDIIDRSAIRTSPREPILPDECALTAFVRRGREITSQRSAFLSYPPQAHLYASLLKRKLENRFRISDPAGIEFETVDEQLSREIGDCDVFIGIWLPESGHSGLPAPWLHIELGAAVAQGKRAMILYPEGMDIEVLQRLGPNVLPVPFSYATFESQTLLLVSDFHCPAHFSEAPAESGSVIDSRDLEPSVQRSALPNRAAFARAFIQKNPKGVTAADLYDAFIKEGIPIQRTYVSSLLGRLQDRDLITWRREDKRYYYFATTR